MADGRQILEETGLGETYPPPLSDEAFVATPEFRRFRSGMKKLLKVPKAELDHRVRTAKRLSPRAGNPNAPGRKAHKKGLNTYQ
jgi:hypothetical protein